MERNGNEVCVCVQERDREKERERENMQQPNGGEGRESIEGEKGMATRPSEIIASEDTGCPPRPNCRCVVVG